MVTSSNETRRWTWSPVIVCSLAVVILCLRRPDAFINPQFWAEDIFFFLDAERGGWETLFAPRAGYLHLIPRTIALAASNLDPYIQPAFYILGSVAILLVVILNCLSRRHDLPSKSILALAIVLVPHSGEVFLNPTNAQWIAALAILLTLFKRDAECIREWIFDFGILLFAGLSGPFVILTAPFFGIRAWIRRSRAAWASMTLVFVCAFTQGWFIFNSPGDSEFVGQFSAFSLWANLSYRLVFTLFFGVAAAPELGRVVAIAVALSILGFIVAAILRAKDHRRHLIVLFCYIVVLLASTTLRKRFDLWSFPDLGNGDRYFFIPKVLLLWIVIIVYSSTNISRLFRSFALVLLLSSTLLNSPRFHFVPYRDFDWYSKCDDIKAGKRVTFTINPNWTFEYQRGVHFEMRQPAAKD